MLYRLSAFRPHSSPDPFGATLPPGEGILPPRWGGWPQAQITSP